MVKGISFGSISNGIFFSGFRKFRFDDGRTMDNEISFSNGRGERIFPNEFSTQGKTAILTRTIIWPPFQLILVGAKGTAGSESVVTARDLFKLATAIKAQSYNFISENIRLSNSI